MAPTSPRAFAAGSRRGASASAPVGSRSAGGPDPTSAGGDRHEDHRADHRDEDEDVRDGGQEEQPGERAFPVAERLAAATGRSGLPAPLMMSSGGGKLCPGSGLPTEGSQGP